MQKPSYMEVVKQICAADMRYDMEAYFFIREALDFTIKALNKPEDGPDRHISGAELAAGIRKYALQEFGPITLTVLNSWGITCTDDFGEIVFNLVEAGELGRRDEDRIEDFYDLYDFDEAFEAPFLPTDTSAE